MCALIERKHLFYSKERNILKSSLSSGRLSRRLSLNITSGGILNPTWSSFPLKSSLFSFWSPRLFNTWGCQRQERWFDLSCLQSWSFPSLWTILSVSLVCTSVLQTPSLSVAVKRHRRETGHQYELSAARRGLSPAQLLYKQAVSRSVFTPGRGLAFWWEAVLADCLLLLRGLMFGPFCPVAGVREGGARNSRGQS